MLTRKTQFNISRTKKIEDVDLLRYAVSSCEDVPTTDNGTTTKVAFPTSSVFTELIPQHGHHPRKFLFHVHFFDEKITLFAFELNPEKRKTINKHRERL